MSRTKELRDNLFDLITEPACNKREERCPFWDVQGHYCFADEEERKVCPFINDIFHICAEAGLRFVDEDAELPEAENPYNPSKYSEIYHGAYERVWDRAVRRRDSQLADTGWHKTEPIEV